jgi:hypothetical protein
MCMKTELEQLKEQLNSISEKIKQLETTSFQKGKWYKRNKELLVWNDYKKTYGFTEDGMWSNDMLFSRDLNICVPATDKEVEEALIKEAKKRGFKDGVKIKPVSGDINILFDNKFEYLKKWHEYKNALFIDNYLVFSNGKWAEIIKDEPIKVGGYEVKKNADYYEIGCREIPKCDIKDLSIFMSSQRFTKVSFDGVETDLETINKILDL